MIKILHIIEDFSLSSGGLRTVVKDLNEKLNNYGFKSYIISSDKENEEEVFIVRSENKWNYSARWKREIISRIKELNIDIIHIHGVWMYPQFIASKIALKMDIPFILTPHGMYEPWLWKKGALKKKYYFKGISYKYFSKANVIQAITSDEKENLKVLFPKTKIIEIPNLITSEFDDDYQREIQKYILYVGRLDSKKGIDLLIESFSKLDTNKFKLKILGGFNEYKQELDEIVLSLNISDRVEFLGLKNGREKDELFANAWVFVAPSYSEVIGMVNLESAILKTPVITTYQTGLKKEFGKYGGLLINPEVGELTKALTEVVNWSEEQRNTRGLELYNYVRSEYSWEMKFQDWIQTYESIKEGK